MNVALHLLEYTVRFGDLGERKIVSRLPTIFREISRPEIVSHNFYNVVLKAIFLKVCL